MDELDTVRTVEETKEGTKISSEFWGTDKDALFPLQAALGYSMTQSLFVGKNNLVVEGITDYWYLSCLSTILKNAGESYLNENIIITPAGGAQKTTFLTVMLSGQKLNVGLLLDTDSEGVKVSKDIIKNKILKDSKIIYINESIDDNTKEMEFEDIFPVDFYINYVNKSYEKELAGTLISLPFKENNPKIISTLKKIFSDKGLEFHKTRPARLMLEDFGKTKIEDLPPQLIERVKKLIEIINIKMEKK